MKTIVQTIDKDAIVDKMFNELKQEFGNEGIGILFPNLSQSEQASSAVEIYDTEAIESVDTAQEGMRLLLNEGEVTISNPVETEKLSRILRTLNVDHIKLSNSDEDYALFVLQEDVSKLV
ncbi:hypothetical protein SP15_162 [Bacillus phage SP-15]|uniref:Uncharacterized protein n=1 Tax=Bacillus phage SP-15 TaxID=1792032 RepID=A0A127AWH9_9CAUD|nr:hypothetical protein SP15_162 [Bacillus phage SP-15]AMM44960.1 hypothetical protein SP15_162 [Bacillus phage SP-15]